MGSDGARYKAIVTHHTGRMLHAESFHDLDKAKRWLFRRWAGLPLHLRMIERFCGWAIYDQHDNGKRVFTMGADALVEERR